MQFLAEGLGGLATHRAGTHPSSGKNIVLLSTCQLTVLQAHVGCMAPKRAKKSWPPEPEGTDILPGVYNASSQAARSTARSLFAPLSLCKCSRVLTCSGQHGYAPHLHVVLLDTLIQAPGQGRCQSRDSSLKWAARSPTGVRSTGSKQTCACLLASPQL